MLGSGMIMLHVIFMLQLPNSLLSLQHLQLDSGLKALYYYVKLYFKDTSLVISASLSWNASRNWLS